MGVSGLRPRASLAETLPPLLPERPLRIYPAAMSVEADAIAWARDDAVDGAVVTADYQVAPRGRGGLEWEVRAGRDVAFSMILRPSLPEAREGWLYTVATVALSDLDDGASVRWPDEVHRDADLRARVGVQTGIAAGSITWAVVSVLRRDVDPAQATATAVAAIERRLGDDPGSVLADHRARVATLGQRVRARMVPMGPAGVVHEGEAVAVRDDGGLAIRTAAGALLRVVPQALGMLELVDGAAASP